MKAKKQKGFAFSVSLILLMFVLLPLTTAWFVGVANKIRQTTVNLGTVAVGVGDTIVTSTNISEGSVAENFEGETFNFEFEIYNSGNIDSYCMMHYEVFVTYNAYDITSLLTIPTNYLTITDTTLTTNPNFYSGGNASNKVFVLSSSECLGSGKKVTGKIKFANTLPEYIQYGDNYYYLKNPNTSIDIRVGVKVYVATVQKPNNTAPNAYEYLHKLLPSYTPEYTLDGSGNMVVDGTSVGKGWDVGAMAGTVFAYFDENTNKLTVVGEGAMKDFSYDTTNNTSNYPYSEIASQIETIEIKDGVTSIGQGAFAKTIGLLNIDIPTSVTSVGNYAFAYSGLTGISVPSSVTNIGTAAFTNCTNLVKVELPSTITDVKESTFSYCENVKRITIPDSVTAINRTAFNACYRIANIKIGSKVATIGEYAFHAVQFNLKQIVIPKSVKTIAASAFANCYTLEKVYMEHTSRTELTSIDNTWLTGSTNAKVYYYSTYPKVNHWRYQKGVPTIWEDVQTSGYSLFKDEENTPYLIYEGEMVTTTKAWDVSKNRDKTVYAFLVEEGASAVQQLSTTISSSGTTSLIIVGDGIMKDYFASYQTPWYAVQEKITRVIVAEKVTHLGNYFISGFPMLTEILLLDNCVTSIGDLNIINCKKLENITIPTSVTSIGEFSLILNPNLKYINVEEGNTYYNSHSSNCIIETSTFKLIVGCRNTTIPTFVTEIGECAFAGCVGLTSINIPNSVTTIGGDAFYASGLTSINLSNNLTYIGPSAFELCNLRQIDIPASLEAIGEYAFTSSANLKTITSNNSRYIAEQNSLIDTQTDTLILGCSNSAIPQTGVTRIGTMAFAYCYTLSNLVIPASITSIDQAAFYGCSGLNNIYLEHTSASSLPITNGWNYNATVYYYSETTVSDGLHWHLNEQGVPTVWPTYTLDTSSGTPTIKFDDMVVTTDSYTEVSDDRETDDKVYAFISTDNENSTPTIIIAGEGAVKDNTTTSSISPSNKETIEEVIATNGVTNIGSYSFYNYPALTTVDLSASSTLETIGKNAFTNCSSLTTATLPSSLKTISAYAFDGCNNLTNLIIPNGVTTIESYAFNGCYSLTSITIPSSVKTISSYAFNACSNLKTINFTEGLETIGDYAFYNCLNIDSFNLPASVKSIGYAAFSNPKVTTLTVAGGNTTYTSPAGSNCIITRNTDAEGHITLVAGCSTSIIPSGVTRIGWGAFQNCKNLKTLSLPNTVTHIDDYAFIYCSGLTSIEIPASVTHIGQGALANMNLTSLTVAAGNTTFTSPQGSNCIIKNNVLIAGCNGTDISKVSGVTSIGPGAFQNCSGLTGVFKIPSTVTTISSWAFNGTGIETFVLPSGLQTVGQNVFGNINLKYFAIYNYSSEMYFPVTSNDAFNLAEESSAVIDGEVVTVFTQLLYGSTLIAGTNITNIVNCNIIASGAFNGCSNLNSITLTSDVTTIQSSAFASCSGLTSIIIPSSVTIIGTNVFQYSNASLTIKMQKSSDSGLSLGTNWHGGKNVVWGYTS